MTHLGQTVAGAERAASREEQGVRKLESNGAGTRSGDSSNARVPRTGLYTAGSRSIDTSFDHVILVDKNDRALGTMAKLDAHRLGRSHRAISVIVRDSFGRLLLQQRAAGKYHSAELWTNTCCSHPRPNESAIDAAARRLAEEMGIVTSVRPLFTMRYRARVSNRLVEHEFVHVFGGISDQAPKPVASEVAAWRWMSCRDVMADAGLRPHDYTVWFRKVLQDFKAEIETFCAS
jgi:isopentenyl-diphosphate delta-isomerase